MTFFNKATGTEQIALQKGRISLDTPTLVRMHQFSPFTDLLGQEGPRSKLLSRSMELIGEAGSGVVLILNRTTLDAFPRLYCMKACSTEQHLDELVAYGAGGNSLAGRGG